MNDSESGKLMLHAAEDRLAASDSSFNISLGGGYGSELEDVQDKRKHTTGKPEDAESSTLFKKPTVYLKSNNRIFSKPSFDSSVDKERRSAFGRFLRGMNAYERHKMFINEFVIHYGRQNEYLRPLKEPKTDFDILRETYKFIRSEEDNDDSTWEKRIAKKYYDKLFKEYCLADMELYKEGKIGLRWRTQAEVMNGKGQFICGNKRCNSEENLKSFEVNFAYVENGEKRNILVKLRVCPDCAYKLNYKKLKEEKKLRKLEEKRAKRNRELNESQVNEDVSQIKKRKGDENKVESRYSEGRQEQNEKRFEQAENTWKQKPELEKTKEEEFDEYFDGLFP